MMRDPLPVRARSVLVKVTSRIQCRRFLGSGLLSVSARLRRRRSQRAECVAGVLGAT